MRTARVVTSLASRAIGYGVGALLLSGCDALRTGFLDAKGPIAGDERQLFVTVVIVMMFVIGPVILLTPIFAWHYRLANRDAAFRPGWNFSWFVEFLIWIPPTAIVIGLGILLWHRTLALDPYSPLPTGTALEVQAVALDWKWLFIYPEQHVAVINELALPAGRPVHLTLTSGTVMQSLFIPQLAGQIYAMPGMTTQLNLAARSPGRFLGENTQYNGTGFPRQRFTVQSLSPSDFEHWVAAIRESHRPLDDAAFNNLFAKSTEAVPVRYSETSENLFHRILAQSTEGAPIAATPDAR